MRERITLGNNPMVGATVAVAVSVQQAADEGKFLIESLILWAFWRVFGEIRRLSIFLCLPSLRVNPKPKSTRCLQNFCRT